MKNKKGFISMTLVYSFLTLFLVIMAAIMLSQTEKSNYINYVNDKVSEDMENIKGRSSSLIKRMLEDNVVTDGSIFKIGEIANNEVGNGNGLYYIDGGSGSDIITDENNDGVGSRIYFYRGEVDNNYVLISKLKDASTTNYCFRIIRTNENGSIRLMYIKKDSCSGNAAGIGTSPFSQFNDDNAFVGYTHGKAETKMLATPVIFSQRGMPADQQHTEFEDTHSFFPHDLDQDESHNLLYFKVLGAVEYHDKDNVIKSLVDEWYAENLNPISSAFSDSIYCIDRNYSTDTTMGIAIVPTPYKSRNIANKTYSFKCNRKLDQISLSISRGGSSSLENALDYPVGLPTVDDIAFAGGGTEANNFYLKTGKSYWTMSPYAYEDNGFGTNVAKEVYVKSDGSISSEDVKFYTEGASNNINIFPVVSVRPDIIVNEGSGTASSPYKIIISE